MKKYFIKDLMQVNRGSSPRPIIEYLSDSGYRWLKISDFKMYDRYVYDTKEHIKESGLKNTRHLPAGTLILTNSATPGIPIFLGRDMCLHDGFLYFSNVKENIININYLYYWFLYNKSSIVNQANGSVFQNLKKEIIENCEIEVPNIDTQRKIVNILDSINLKIELNNNINKRLLELSNINYYEFIKLLDSNEECDYKNLPELGKISMGQSPKGESYNYEKNGLPLINGAADYEDGYLKAQKYTSNPIKTCKKNDLLFCIRATIGLLVICDKEYCLGRGVAGITNIDSVYKEYAFHIIDSSIEDFKRMATGSVIVGISRDNIEKISVKIPSKSEIEKYHSIEKPIFDKIENIRIENLKLKELRDTLLPRLINGEIDLNNVQI